MDTGRPSGDHDRASVSIVVSFRPQNDQLKTTRQRISIGVVSSWTARDHRQATNQPHRPPENRNPLIWTVHGPDVVTSGPDMTTARP
jgi:hypothetical protein